jgi:hypothetical protein
VPSRSRLLGRLDPVVVAAVVVGSVVRLVWVWVAARPPVGLIDQTAYLGAAEGLVDGAGYTRFGAPSAYYPPGYPLLLAGAMAIVRTVWEASGPTVAGLVNVVVTAVAIGATAVVARRLVDTTAARWVAWLAALLPGSVVAAASALTEPAYIALVAVGLVALVGPDGSLRTSAELVGGRALAPVVMAGAAWGLAVLVRPVLLLGLPVLVVASGWGRGIRGRVAAGVLCAVVLAVLAPWVARNAVVMDRVALSTNTGDNLCIGHHDGAPGHFAVTDDCQPSAPTGGTDPESFRRAEIARDAELTRRAVSWALRHPVDELGLVPRRVWFTLAPDHEAVDAVESYGADPWLGPTSRTLLRLAEATTSTLVLVLGAWGMVRELRRRPRATGWWAVVAAIAGPLLSVVVFFGGARFAVPVVWLALLGVGALIARPIASR